jgi:hypothetical protein
MEEIFLITTEENTHHQSICYIIKYPQFGERKKDTIIFMSLTRSVSGKSLQCWRRGFSCLCVLTVPLITIGLFFEVVRLGI